MWASAEDQRCPPTASREPCGCVTRRYDAGPGGGEGDLTVIRGPIWATTLCRGHRAIGWLDRRYRRAPRELTR